MKIILSRKGLLKNSTSLGEVLLLLAYYNKEDLQEAHSSLLKKGYIDAIYNTISPGYKWRVTEKGKEKIDSVIIDSEEFEKTDEEIMELAGNLKEIFPVGRKEGTSKYWAEGKALIAKRLKAFYKKYGSSYTDEQIVAATKKYVESFNGNYQFMKTLKYFIFKDQDVAGERDYTSDLLTFIENIEHDEVHRDNWNTELK